MRLSRIIALAVIVASAFASSAVAEPRENPVKVTTRIAETQVSLWRCQDQLGQTRTRASRPPWSLPKSPRYRAWVLNQWQLRRSGCLASLHEVQRQWNWQAWLPPVWRAIGMCETQLNWHHDSGTYQGAFGFYHGSWDSFRLPGYPSEAYLASPWQQYQVALRIYARYGFSGWGCYTHGGYLSHL